MTLTQPPPTARHATKSYRLNATTWARKFNARLLEPGLVSYEDQGCGKALLRKETIDRCIESFVGRPVVCKVNAKGVLVHEKTSPENMKTVGHGYITEVYYNAADGWYYGRGVVDTDEAARAISKSGFGSVGYRVNDAGPGGSWHNIGYEEEILEFSGEHLAIVSNPRYEEATIRLNSKTKTHMNVFKWIKKASRENAGGDDAAKQAAAAKLAADKAAADAAAKLQRENAAAPEEISGETELELEGGAKVTIAQLVEAYNAKGAEAGDLPDDATIAINGKDVTVAELVESHRKLNAADDDESKAKEKADKDAEEKKKRENAAAAIGKSHFKVLLSAGDGPKRTNAPKFFGTREERLNAGKAEYGTTVAGKN